MTHQDSSKTFYNPTHDLNLCSVNYHLDDEDKIYGDNPSLLSKQGKINEYMNT